MSTQAIVPAANPFLHFWNLGYKRLCPITPPDCIIRAGSRLSDKARGKAPGEKGSDGLWQGFNFVAREAVYLDLERWWRWNAGVGIKTGRGLVLIDADTLDGDSATKIMEIADKMLTPGRTKNDPGRLPIRVGNFPKAGYLVRTDDDFRYTKLQLEHGHVEILAEGRQFVAHGTHPGTGRPYEWTRGVPALENVPFVEGARLLAFMDALRNELSATGEVYREGGGGEGPEDQTTLMGPWEAVQRAVRATPNTAAGFPTRKEWVDYGYMIKGAVGPDREAEGLDLWQEWSSAWPGCTAEDAEMEWARMKRPLRVGATKLAEVAEKWSGGAYTRGDIYFDAGEAAKSVAAEAAAKAATLHGLNIISFDDAVGMSTADPAEPLIEGMLDQGAMSVMYGESNTGKTFVAMDMAWHIATGAAWGGRKVAQLPVLYIVAEGGRAALRRVRALSVRRGRAADMHFIVHPINLLHAEADLKPLKEKIAKKSAEIGRPFGLIVVDTLSRAMAGGDENSSVDMGRMVKHIDDLRKNTTAHSMAVHHSGKDKAKGARGHSLLRAATDTEIEITKGRIEVTKQRDMEGETCIGFSLETVTLGVDKSGRILQSCVVQLHDARTASGDALARAETLVKDGVWRDSQQSDDWIGIPVAEAFGIDRDKDGWKRSAGERVKFLVAAKLLESYTAKDSRRRSKLFLRWVGADNMSVSAARGVFD